MLKPALAAGRPKLMTLEEWADLDADRGEMGAGILVVSLCYGLGGEMVTVTSRSLVLNLLGTGLFILIVKRLIA